jgi:hypothetical protein
MPGMDGFINFNGTLEGSIAGGDSGAVKDVKTNASGSYESVVDEQGIAKIDLSNYATDEQLESAVDNINSVLLTKLNKVNYSTEEQNTGIKWIDGKPIYEKVYVLQKSIDVSYNSWTATGISTSEIEQLINVITYYKSSCWGGALIATIDNGDFRFQTTRNGASCSLDKFVVRYTKTADTAEI